MSLRKDIEQNFRRLMEKVDRVSDKEAEEDFDNLADKDLDNDGDTDSSDRYLKKRLGKVAKMDEAAMETGLTFTPRSSMDATKFRNALDDSDFHYEWNAREGYFFFPEEEDTYDALESELQSIVDMNNVNGYFEGIFNEMSTTAGVPGFESPYAFGKVDNDTIEADGWKKTPKTNKFFKRMESKSSDYKKMMSEMYGVQTEAVSYRAYKKDESASPSQKVNKSIMEVNKMLAEIERVVAHNLKLKNESGVNSGQFWKSTGARFSKINERIVRISNRLKELSK